MIYIGIDQSINSSAVCIINDDGTATYHIITPKITKNQKKIQSDKIKYHTYSKSKSITDNINSICDILKSIISPIGQYKIALENVAYNAKGSSLIDLCMLNGAIRRTFPDIQSYPPTSVKKFFTGNGHAPKDLMIYSWKKLENLDLKNIKCDDIADSYAIANMLKYSTNGLSI